MITGWSIYAMGTKAEVRAAVQAADVFDHGGNTAALADSETSLTAGKAEVLQRLDALTGDTANVLAYGPRTDLFPDAQPMILVVSTSIPAGP